MGGSGAVVAGVISLVLCAGSIVAGFLNRVHHPRRFIGFIVLFIIFLIAGVFLVLRGLGSRAGSTPPAAK